MTSEAPVRALMGRMKIIFLFLVPMLLDGCARPVQRFVPVEDRLALDTKTGRYCNPDPEKPDPSSPRGRFPLCYDLYKEDK